jgi:hypothetical protein
VRLVGFTIEMQRIVFISHTSHFSVNDNVIKPNGQTAVELYCGYIS